MSSTTSRPLGHEEVLSLLETNLPRVTMLRGPKAVGKWAMAEHLVRHYEINPADLRQIENLTTAEATAVQEFVSVRPAGPHRIVMARLDGASPHALQSLLKTLEEPPPDTSFLLLTSGRTLPTIESRSEVFRLGLLDSDQIETVLKERFAVSQSLAEKLAKRGDGTVEVPDSVIEDRARAAALTLLKALTDGDDDLLDRVIRTWDQRSHELLQTWVIEALSGRWRVFREHDAAELVADKQIAITLLSTLTKGARPSIALRSGVEPVMVRRRNRI